LNAHVQLIADRFIATSARGVFDLASGQAVALRVMPAGDAAEEARWAARCDTLLRLRHPAAAPLLDYGAADRSRRFEAWLCGSAWTGAGLAADRALGAASAFWRACGLTAGTPGRADVHTLDGRAVVVATPGTGFVAERGSDLAEEASRSIEVCGLQRIDRPAESALAEIFDAGAGPRPSVVQIRGRPGSGRTETALAAARVSRQQGFIPLSSSLLRLVDRRLLEHRRLCLIGDGADEDAWRALVSATLWSAQAHVLLVVGHEEIRGVRGIALNRVAPEALLGAVRPRSLAHAGEVARDVRGARGLPGCFAELLWGRRAGVRWRSRPVKSLRAAERRAVYGAAPCSRDAREALVEERRRDEGSAWPAPGELVALRRRLGVAKDLVAQGRHASGWRQLRQTLGALARRDDWTHALDGTLALTASLLGRGRPREAHEELDAARRFADRLGDERALLDIAVLRAHAYIDLARLDEAESVAGAALLTARAGNDGPRLAAVSLALGRCLFWRGRYAEADAALALAEQGSPSASAEVSRRRLSARAAVGLGDLPRAGSLAHGALDLALASNDSSLIAMAACSAAFVHLAVNDSQAAAADVERAVAAARQARLPLQAVRARLILAEVERRRGCTDRAAAIVDRLGRLDASCLPPIVRARCDLIAETASNAGAVESIVARHRARTGLGGLELYVAGSPATGSSRRADAFDDAIVSILRICQSAEEDGRLLGEVCARLRGDLRAAGVAFVGVEGAGLGVMASDGARLDTALAERVVTSGLTIAPHLCDGRVDPARRRLIRRGAGRRRGASSSGTFGEFFARRDSRRQRCHG
jgi:tetratricopeptide (TPR) repeat protein